MSISTFISAVSLLGGLALFLYGMEVMGNGLKSFSGSALKRVLSKVTGNVVVAFLLGFLITCVIQSSTATIVLTVGLLGAGVLELRPALGIVFGANVGTTITAQIIRLLDVQSSSGTWLDLFTPETLAPLGAIIGILLFKFIKGSGTHNIGKILLGFSVLFTGLLGMTAAMKPLADSDVFKNLIASVSSPFWGLVSGTVITALVQSSSASVGILQSLCSTGVMSFSLCFSYVIGAALGTCVTTAIICSIGTKANAKRAVFVHVLFSIFGGTLFMTVILLLHHFGVLNDLWGTAMSSGDVANFETLFKLVTALLLLPFAGLLERLACRVIKDADTDTENKYAEMQANIQALDIHLFLSPSMALDQTAHVISHMGELALENYDAAVSLLKNYDEAVRAGIEERETLIDQMADASNNYLVELSPKVKSEADNTRLNLLLRAYTEFERIGDLAVNLAEGAQFLYEHKKTFSPEGAREIGVVTDAVREAISLAIAGYDGNGDSAVAAARRVEPLEEVVDDLEEMLKANHIERLKAGACSVSGGMVFLDMLVNLERISDQCSNLAVDILSIGDATIKGNEHGYIEELHSGKDSAFVEEYQRNVKKYVDVLKNAD